MKKINFVLRLITFILCLVAFVAAVIGEVVVGWDGIVSVGRVLVYGIAMLCAGETIILDRHINQLNKENAALKEAQPDEKPS